MADRYPWSDESGKVECTKENTKLPSKHWTWVSGAYSAQIVIGHRIDPEFCRAKLNNSSGFCPPQIFALDSEYGGHKF